jgi:hypothetical protein
VIFGVNGARLHGTRKASLEPSDAFVLATRGDALVDVEEYRECSVPRPTLTDDGVDAFAQPPRARSVAQVVTAQA